jgi:Protein of unknown function (DUF3987)
VTSAIIANVRWPKAGAAWSEPPILRFVNVGSPGSGKSPAQDGPLRLLRHAEEVLAEGFGDDLYDYELEREIAEAEISIWKANVKSGRRSR